MTAARRLRDVREAGWRFALFGVLAVQRLAFPEASPTLPLLASLGLTFAYNVTIGIPVYILIAQSLLDWTPVGTVVAQAAGVH